MMMSNVSYSSSDLFPNTSLIFTEPIFEAAFLGSNPAAWEFKWLSSSGLLSSAAKLLICFYSVASMDKAAVLVS